MRGNPLATTVFGIPYFAAIRLPPQMASLVAVLLQILISSKYHHVRRPFKMLV